MCKSPFKLDGLFQVESVYDFSIEPAGCRSRESAIRSSSGLLLCELVEERPADDYQQNEQNENRSRVRPETAVTDSATACSDSTYTANAV